MARDGLRAHGQRGFLPDVARALQQSEWLLHNYLHIHPPTQSPRYWLYLARELAAVMPELPPDYQRHLACAFNRRAKEMDNALCRLALLLHPKYRNAAVTGAHGSRSSTAARQLLWKKAADVAAARGYSEADIRLMLNQLASYIVAAAPFDLP